MNRPMLIVVTGRGGSGKTTLARKLGEKAHLPVISRDEIKEGYVHTMGMPHEELPDGNLVATNQFFQTVKTLLDGGVSLIAEAAFQHKLWSERLTPLLENVRVVIIVCRPGDDRTAYARYLERREKEPLRVYFHGDPGEAQQEPSAYDPPHMDVETICVDTTDGYTPKIDEIIDSILKNPCVRGEKSI